MDEKSLAKEKPIAAKMETGAQLTDEELAFYVALNRTKRYRRDRDEGAV